MSALPNQPGAAAPPMDQNTLLQLAAMLQRANPGAAGAGLAPPLPAAFGQAQAMPSPTAVYVPMKVQVGQGSVKVLFGFGPEFADPANLMNLLTALANAGFPVDVYVPKQQQGWGGNGGGGGNRWGGNGGGFGGGGGGWRR